jgi:hypothetical protein
MVRTMQATRRAVSAMPVGTRATWSDHDRGRRLYLRRGSDFVAIDSLVLPGGDAP